MFLFKATATPGICTLPLHAALPVWVGPPAGKHAPPSRFALLGSASSASSGGGGGGGGDGGDGGDGGGGGDERTFVFEWAAAEIEIGRAHV